MLEKSAPWTTYPICVQRVIRSVVQAELLIEDVVGICILAYPFVGIRNP